MADTTVTGRIGDMDVALINAASEATLMKLVESMNALSNKVGSAGAGNSSNDQNSPQGQNNAAVKASTTAFNKAGQAVGAFAGAIVDATKGLLNFAGNLIGGTFLALKNLTTELLMGGSRVSDFTKHLANLPSVFGMLGSIVHGLSSYLENTVDTFRSLSQVGAGYTGSLTDMMRMAAQSGMTLDRFSKTVTANAESMALFGPTMSQGAKQFGKLSNDLRNSEAGTRLMNMGFSIDEINETLITYANINSRMGRDRARTDSELIARAAEFGEELTRAAAATGLSRKALGDAANALSKDSVIQSIMRRLGPERAAEFQAAVTSFTAKFKESSGTILDVLSGVFSSPEARALVSQAPEMAATIMRLRRGEIDQITFHNTMIEQAQRRQRELQALSPETLQRRREIAGFAAYERNINEMAAGIVKSREQIDKEMKAQANSQNIDRIYKTFENLIETFRATFALKFLESEAFKNFNTVINGVLGKGPGFENVLDSLLTAFEDLLNGVSQFISDWQAFGFKQALENSMASVKASIEAWWKRNTGDGSFYEKMKTDISEAITKGIQDGANSIWNSVVDFVKKFQTEILTGVALFLTYQIGKKFVGGVATGAGTAVGQRMGGGVTSGAPPAGFLTSLGGQISQAAGWLLKGVAIGASLVAIGKGLEYLAVGVKAFEGVSADELVASGAALVGVTAAITAFAKLGPALANPKALAGIGIAELAIAGLGLALQQFPTAVLKEFGVIVATTFQGMSQILETTGAAIDRVIGSITKMRIGVIEATTKQIKDLSDVPSANIVSAANAIEKLKLALDGFSPGMLRGFSEMLGGIFSKDKAGPLEKMAELGPKLGVAAPGFTAFKEAIGNGFNVTGLSLTPQQARSVEILANNLPAYAAGLQSVSSMGPNLQNTATALQAFVTASQGVDLNKFVFSKEQSANLADGTNKIRDLAAQLSNASREFKKLDDTGLKQIKTGVEGLSEAFKKFNKSFIEEFLPKFDSMKTKTQEGLLSEVGSKLDTLNSNMTALVGIERDSRGFLSTISTKKPGKIS